MKDEDRGSLSSIVWGLFLIALGGAFLLQRFGMLDLPSLGRIWPLVFLPIGITHLFDRRPGSGIMFLLMGGWFIAVEYEWMGFTYRNSWPLLLVVFGTGMVIEALSGEDRRRRRREA